MVIENDSLEHIQQQKYPSRSCTHQKRSTPPTCQLGWQVLDYRTRLLCHRFHILPRLNWQLSYNPAPCPHRTHPDLERHYRTRLPCHRFHILPKLDWQLSYNPAPCPHRTHPDLERPTGGTPPAASGSSSPMSGWHVLQRKP
uniref:Uncharacterized protein n=1 Tax=Arundo donax TaxID=35708 RepID=A0A0A9D297_ARUDO